MERTAFLKPCDTRPGGNEGRKGIKMKKLTIDQVAAALASSKYVSVELYDDGIEYWLHIDEDGNIVPFVQDAAESFVYPIRSDEIPGFAEAEDMDFIYTQESMETGWFYDAVCSLTAQANAWIAENC